MDEATAKKSTYHHGALREELIRRGLEALEREGAEALSLRSLAEAAGVSKAAPYRHFKDKDHFLGALADEGFRRLYAELDAARQGTARSGEDDGVGRMGQAYMGFAIRTPALYRLMSSSLLCRVPDESLVWARRSLMLLAESLAGDPKRAAIASRSAAPRADGLDETAAAWAYIHGLTLIRIDRLYPADLPEPDWDRLARAIPKLPDAIPGRSRPDAPRRP
jgi:AcrR family transcriptional regulator